MFTFPITLLTLTSEQSLDAFEEEFEVAWGTVAVAKRITLSEALLVKLTRRVYFSPASKGLEEFPNSRETDPVILSISKTGFLRVTPSRSTISEASDSDIPLISEVFLSRYFTSEIPILTGELPSKAIDRFAARTASDDVAPSFTNAQS